MLIECNYLPGVYPRLRREGFYLVCLHFLRSFARKKCKHTKDYFLGQLPAK